MFYPSSRTKFAWNWSTVIFCFHRFLTIWASTSPFLRIFECQTTKFIYKLKIGTSQFCTNSFCDEITVFFFATTNHTSIEIWITTNLRGTASTIANIMIATTLTKWKTWALNIWSTSIWWWFLVWIIYWFFTSWAGK